MDFTIRTATPDDAGALLAIYRPYVEETAITFELEVPTVDEFRGRVEATLARYPWIVAEDAGGGGHVERGGEGQERGALLGYAYAGPFKSRAAYAWSVETSIYLNRDVRGRGLGRVLYGELERILQAQGIRNLNACIACTDREDDPHLTNGSVRFHEKLGYQTVGTFHRCGSKFGRWYDMQWMEKFIGPHDENPQPPIPFPELPLT